MMIVYLTQLGQGIITTLLCCVCDSPCAPDLSVLPQSPSPLPRSSSFNNASLSTSDLHICSVHAFNTPPKPQPQINYTQLQCIVSSWPPV